MGEKHPPAKESLVAKKDSSLKLLHENCDPERFHDYETICKYLGQHSESLSTFLAIHNSDPELASKIVGFIWDRLVREKLWEVCASHLGDPEERYRHLLFRYDQSMGICLSDPSLGGENFAKQIEGWFVRDATNLLLVLINSNQQLTAESFIERIAKDTEEGNCRHVKKKVMARVNL